MVTAGSIGGMVSKKYSISLPEDLAEQARERARDGLSAYIAEALEHRVAMDKLRELIDDYHRDHEAFTAEELAAAREELGFERHHRSTQAGAA
jgi:hypothetical protein